MPAKDGGGSLMKHYRAIEAQGVNVPELDMPEFPDLLEGVFTKFLALHHTRAISGSGPCAISFDAIMKFRDLYGWEFSLWELETVRELDSIYIRVVSEKTK